MKLLLAAVCTMGSSITKLNGFCLSGGTFHGPQTLEGKASMKSQVPPCHEAGLCCLIVLVLTPKHTSAPRSAQDVLSCLSFPGKDPDIETRVLTMRFLNTQSLEASWQGLLSSLGLGNKKRKKKKTTTTHATLY